jgi:predicted nicotinamide N-methyase
MLRRHAISIGSLTVQLDSLTNFDELFDRLLAKGDDSEEVQDERIPYWSDLWPSAVALSLYMAESGIVTPATSVIEIGCGLGLPGVVAGMLGARDVLFTDYLEEPLEYARRNWELNCAHPARYRRLDWREPDPALAADVVLASDIAYETRFFPYLPHAFKTLCKPGGCILFSEPGREVAQAFLDLLPSLGFEVNTAIVEGELNKLPYRVGVYALRPISAM